ncbi:hypothetical protein RB196_29335 [Streptomyces sp. PmtA]|uniref:hypothetical protein n=1 Tax=Streptomyces sp. PmtA TaxID=3074275 RepID=UPI0030158587
MVVEDRAWPSGTGVEDAHRAGAGGQTAVGVGWKPVAILTVKVSPPVSPDGLDVAVTAGLGGLRAQGPGTAVSPRA